MADWDDKLEKWYKALYEEDCKEVMSLLEVEPTLLMEGWESSSRRVRGSRLNYWMDETEGPWIGRTALHVGARRGSTELLTLVLKLCGVEVQSFPKEGVGTSKAEEKPSSSNIVLSTRDSPDRTSLSESEDREGKMIAASPLSQQEGDGADRKGKKLAGSRPLQEGEETDRKGKEIPDSSLLQKGEGTDSGGFAQADSQQLSIDSQRAASSSSIQRVPSRSVRSRLMRALSLSKSKADDKKFVRGPSRTSSGRTVRPDDRGPGRPGALSATPSKREVDDIISETIAGVSDLLENLLLAKDGEYKLDAIAMAAVNGNVDVLTILFRSSFYCERILERYCIRKADFPMRVGQEGGSEKTKHALRRRVELANINKEVIKTFSGDSVFQIGILGRYEKHRDFNFLPLDLYLFHFLLTDLNVAETLFEFRGFSGGQIHGKCAEVRAAIRDKVLQSPELRCFLWELQDGQGRPPLGIAVDEDTLDRGFEELARWLTAEETTEETFEPFERRANALDGGGRTPMHRAVALGRNLSSQLASDIMKDIFDIFCQIELTNFSPYLRWVNAIKYSLSTFQGATQDSLCSRCGFSLDVNKLSKENGFHGNEIPKGGFSTLLESAIIHKRQEFLKQMDNESHRNIQIVKRACYMYVPQLEKDVSFDTLELAVMVGDELVVANLLQKMIRNGEHMRKHGEVFEEVHKDYRNAILQDTWVNSPKWQIPFTALHLAAAAGKYNILKLLTDHEHMDPYMEDDDGNSPLHHATKGSVIEFHPRLFDYVNCHQILDTQKDRKENEIDSLQRKLGATATDDTIVDREGCIDLLLQLGCNVFKTNKDNQAPYPGPHMNAKFRSWWLDKRTKEFGVEQNILANAASAIAVTGTLVATASYVGPLQPPLGYADDPTQLQLQLVWIKVFIVCDTMSFYLAIAAVIFSLVPSLPVPQQPMIDELRRTRMMVTIATMVLFPSIIFVIIAFASSSIAVIQDNRSVWNYGGLTIATASIGGLFCLVAIVVFFIRMIGFIWHKHTKVKKLYELTSF